MPKLTVTTSPTPVPEKVGRKQLFVRAYGDVRFAWRSDVTFSTAGTQGVLLKEADGIMALGGRELDLSAELYFIAGSGTVDLEWEEKA
jgi:hypothetical protein